MTQLQKYTWLIDTIRRAGKISLSEISELWENDKDMSDYEPLPRATFNRWREEIRTLFGIDIECQRSGGYLYYIKNPEEIDNNELKKWLLDSFAVGNLIGSNLAVKNRIIVDPIPSGRYHLTSLVNAMQQNRVVNLTYKSFRIGHGKTFPVEPLCVKLFENRWYLLAKSCHTGDYRIYGLDRIEKAEPTDKTFAMPGNFRASEYFQNFFGVVADRSVEPVRIVIRANKMHANYLRTLPLHPSQEEVDDCGEYTDFDMYLAPTYDFVMKLLSFGAMIEVISPASLRKEMHGWINEMHDLYRD